MRSGDGDRSFLRSICTVVFLFASLALDASEYLISYRYVVKDATLFNENLQISPAMQSCQGTPQTSMILDRDNTADLRSLIKINREKFLNYLHKLGLYVTHDAYTTNMQQHATTTMTLKTTCFQVDFNDNFVKIAPIK
ncbi:MAG: hypothetical protein FAF05_02215 [Epsilonproteobacteria bacterium]|nr:hypothetical protein [Campylobacterota bacterium]